VICKFISTDWLTDKLQSLVNRRSDIAPALRPLNRKPKKSCKTVRTIETKLKQNWNKICLKLFWNRFLSAKTKRPAVKRFSCFSQSCRYTLFARQTRGGAGRWGTRDVVVVSAAYFQNCFKNCFVSVSFQFHFKCARTFIRSNNAWRKSVMREVTYVDVSAAVSRSQIVEDGRFVEVSQIGHVFQLFELGRIHLLNQVFLQRLLLQVPRPWSSSLSSSSSSSASS